MFWWIYVSAGFIKKMRQDIKDVRLKAYSITKPAWEDSWEHEKVIHRNLGWRATEGGRLTSASGGRPRPKPVHGAFRTSISHHHWGPFFIVDQSQFDSGALVYSTVTPILRIKWNAYSYVCPEINSHISWQIKREYHHNCLLHHKYYHKVFT
jgi:hypothetical protein